MIEKNTVLQLNSYGMGTGDESLGLTLLQNYFTLIIQENALPQVITFYNAGVKLVCEGSPVINILKAVEAEGVKLIACKTCLNFYGVLDKLEVGMGGTMIDIITFQKEAQKVITL